MFTDASTTAPVAGGQFYFGMALTCALVAFVGFLPTYWAPLAAGSLAEAPVVHLHAVLFSAWSLFFILQARLAGTGRIAQHRAIGLLGISLASMMLIVGLATAIHSTEAQIASGFGERARSFLIVPVSTILFFATAVAIAIINRRQAEIHKRWMLVASVAILMAATARIVRFLRFGSDPPPGLPPVEASMVPALTTDMLLVVAMIHDWRTRGRVHPAYWIGGGAWLAVQLGRIPISKTPQWQVVADWLLSF